MNNREIVFNKYGGRCAYCGCKLQKGWHVDHLEPVRRGYNINDKLVMSNHEKDCIENKMPACASCNINKHSMPLEHFRNLISGFMKYLNEINTQYKIAKRYGLVKEDIKPVIFYFETFNKT